MAGGLVQLVSYGSEDIFLTGSPQITFFKILYRRHTNFSTESIIQHFIGIPNFGEEISVIVDKCGDLMNRVYLEIEFPKADLIKDFINLQSVYSKVKNQLECLKTYRSKVDSYFKINIDIIRKLNILIGTTNIPFSDIESIMSNENFIKCLVDARSDLQKYIATNNDLESILNENLNKTSTNGSNFIFDLVQKINQLDVHLAFLEINSTKEYPQMTLEEICNRKKNRIKFFITKKIYLMMQNFYAKINSAMILAEKTLESISEKNYVDRYSFAWVEEIGHAIIDFVEIRIGNQIIDKHTGDWMNIFNKLYLPIEHQANYDQMIGNNPGLTVLDTNAKDSFKIIVPLQFWFCRSTGLSLPLISLNHSDIMFSIKLKELFRLCYTNDENLNFDSIQTKYNLNLVSANLYIDYIFLENDERRRFAQSTHEYLIETVQYNEIDNIAGTWINAHLTFTNPTKFVAWFAQPQSFRENISGTNKCQWNKYLPVSATHLRLNTCDLTDPQFNPVFFDSVYPTQYFNGGIDGLNVYSFSTDPMNHQPSSTLNLSRIDDFGLYVSFGAKHMNWVNETLCNTYLAAYTMSYNILRIMGGMAGLAVRRI